MPKSQVICFQLAPEKERSEAEFQGFPQASDHGAAVFRLAFADFESEVFDQFQRFERRLAVVGAFLFGQLLVGDQAGVFLAGVVAFGSETPALGDAGSRPYLVDVARERFGEGCSAAGSSMRLTSIGCGI